MSLIPVYFLLDVVLALIKPGPRLNLYQYESRDRLRWLLLILLSSLPSFASSSENLSNFQPERAYEEKYYIESNLEFTLLHELGHAVIDIHKIPVLGGQEKAADQFAVMLMIITNQGVDSALMDKLVAVSGEWMLEWQEEIRGNLATFWDTHPLPIQRFYEIACLVYGADPDSVETFRTDSWLPIERAWLCSEEYIKNREALAWMAKKYSRVYFDANWGLKDQVGQSPNQGKIILQVMPPITVQDKKTYQFLSNSQRLNYIVSEANRILMLDQDIYVVFDPACFDPDAWWSSEQRSIFICYPLVEQFSRHSKHLMELVDQLEGQPEFTLVLKIPEDIRLRMIKESLSPAKLNQQIIRWFREQNNIPEK
jgi:hypothetical protein